tara:strand:- start:2056 stop:2241 length:186 start_codon:yes stop_codon:yes gene_type:complete
MNPFEHALMSLWKDNESKAAGLKALTSTDRMVYIRHRIFLHKNYSTFLGIIPIKETHYTLP